MKFATLVFLLLISVTSYSQSHIDTGFVKGQFLLQTKNKNDALLFIEKANQTIPSAQLQLHTTIAPDLGIYLLTFNADSVNQSEYLYQLKKNPNIIAIQNNHYVKERVVPNDSLFPQMWAMKNTGQNGGTIGADINATSAWEISTGGLTSTGDTLVVAVIDGGFYLPHKDLTFWKNYAEIPGDSIDNDNNGYIDDVNGWNAYTNTPLLSTNNTHGTHVSGTVGAIGNNSMGVTGVNWSVKVMPVMGSSETESVVVTAYNYILKQRKIYNRTHGDSGAFVVSTNASFGKDYGRPINFPIWCAVYDSLGVQGILSAAATANLNIDVDVQGDIPTTCTSNYLIAVTNTTRADVRYAQGAGYGATSIDLGAPGTSIYSTYPADKYAMSTGTSMASPHVAGAVALMLSSASPAQINLYKQKPDSMALVFKNWLLCGTDFKPDLLNKTVTGGRLNLHNALQNVLNNDTCDFLATAQPDFLKTDLKLFSAYPNPSFGGYINLAFSINSQNITMVIYDVLGQPIIQQLLNENSIGIKQHLVRLPALSSGHYFVRLQTQQTQSNPLSLIIVN